MKFKATGARSMLLIPAARLCLKAIERFAQMLIVLRSLPVTCTPSKNGTCHVSPFVCSCLVFRQASNHKHCAVQKSVCVHGMLQVSSQAHLAPSAIITPVICPCRRPVTYATLLSGVWQEGNTYITSCQEVLQDHALWAKKGILMTRYDKRHLVSLAIFIISVMCLRICCQNAASQCSCRLKRAR